MPGLSAAFPERAGACKTGAVLRFIEKLNAYPYEKNKGLVGFILILTLVCIFTSQNVRFNEDMMSLNYEPAHLKQAENKLTELFDKQEKTVLFVSTGKDMGDATGTIRRNKPDCSPN